MPNPNSSSARAPRRPKVPATKARAATLERLLDGAQAVFAERGYQAATIHAICLRARVGIGTFYAHFADKRELLQQVMVERAPLFSRRVTAADLIARPRLVQILRDIVDDPGSAGMWRAWHDAVLQEPEARRFHIQWRKESRDELTATIRVARARAPSRRATLEPTTVAWTVMAVIRELTIADRGGAPGIETAADLVQQLVLGSTKPA